MIDGCFSINNKDLLFSQKANGLYRQQLPEELGTGYTDQYEFSDNVHFFDSCFKTKQALAIISKIDNQHPRLVLTIGIQGGSQFVDQQKQIIPFQAAYSTITSITSSLGYRHYPACSSIRQLRISVDKPWLLHYCGEEKLNFLAKEKYQLIRHRPSLLAVTQLSSKLTHPDDSFSFNKMLLQGQLYTILAYELEAMFADQFSEPNHFHAKDKAIANMARDILYAEYHNPPTMPELAKRVGVNQLKLKRLFHIYFNNTPYQLLTEYRMHLAYEWLKMKNMQVSEVAERIGFSQISNFSAAFTKHYGVSPKSLSKRK